jgi:hypothetical protein
LPRDRQAAAVRLRRRQQDVPCACGCRQLAERLAEYEALNRAIVRTIVTLRPRAAHHGVAAGLAGWGVEPADAAALAAAWQQAQP